MNYRKEKELQDWGFEEYHRLLKWNPETKGCYVDYSDCDVENWSDSQKRIMMEIHGSYQQARHRPSKC